MTKIIIIIFTIFSLLSIVPAQAGCFMEDFDIYLINNMVCEGECDNTKIVRDDESQLLYNSCHNNEQCQEVKLGYGPDCSGTMYNIYFKDPRLIYDSGMTLTKTDLRDQLALSSTVGTMLLRFDLVKDGIASAKNAAQQSEERKEENELGQVEKSNKNIATALALVAAVSAAFLVYIRFKTKKNSV